MLDRALRGVLKEPYSVQKRAYLAYSLSKMDLEEAQDIWLATARLAASRGLFFHALTIIRNYLLGHRRNKMLEELAERYSKDRPKERKLIPPPLGEPLSFSWSDEKELIQLSIKVGLDVEKYMLPKNAMLPDIPIFDALSKEPFVILALHLKKEQLEEKQLLLKQGEEDSSVYLLSLGEVHVFQKKANGQEISLARVKAPAIIGEMALITSLPRRANVVALRDSFVWKIDEEVLTYFAEKAPDVLEELSKIVKMRLLENLLSSSPIFVDSKEKELLLEQFVLLEVQPDAQIFPQNAPPPGLFVILHGEAEVWLTDPQGSRSRIAVLDEGDAFGEFSLLTNKPTTAEIWMPEGGALLHLSRERYQAIRSQTPHFEKELKNLMEIRHGDLELLVSPILSEFEEVEEENILDFLD